MSVVVFGTSKPLRKQFKVSVLSKSRRVQVTSVGAQVAAAQDVVDRPSAEVRQDGAEGEKVEAQAAVKQENAGGAEWVLTLRSKYLRKIRVQGEAVHMACAWRKGPEKRRPIDLKRIIWRGGESAAREMRIACCPASACRC